VKTPPPNPSPNSGRGANNLATKEKQPHPPTPSPNGEGEKERRGEFDILIPGHYFCDLIFTGMREIPAPGTEIYAQGMEVVPGGGAINTVVALNRLNVNAGWIGVVGNDFASRYVSDWLEGEGIDLSLVEHRDEPFRRLTAALSYPTDRAFITYVDPQADLIPLLEKQLTEIRCRHVHFPGLLIDERLPDLIKRWRERGITVSMDCQHRPHTLNLPLVRETLSQLDLFMPNTSEAMHLTETESLSQAAAELGAIVPRLVMKDGANGSFLWEESTMLHAPALSVTPVDTTGAGDVFNAGFLAAQLAGYDAITCLRWGNICGGLSTLGYGGAASAPHKDEIEIIIAQGG